ncbi:response regulator transcription factor [Nocardia brasiliensis]|uniref:response regulator transcription factor n=1 Tax=Nocardia brasiliensis TaxID=37326 RepID=UPI003D92281C
MTMPSDHRPGTGRRPALLGRLPRMTRSDGSPIRALVVDDERSLTGLVTRALEYEGWLVDVAHDGREAIRRHRDNPPDVVVLDIMLPDLDGLQVLQNIQGSGRSTPTLFLTARDSVHDRVIGLTAGGDDYMTKPFSLDELVARLRGLLRRANTGSGAIECLTVGDLELNESSHTVQRAGRPIQLSTTEFELLRYLMNHAGRTVSRAQILDRVWNYNFAGRSNIVDLYVSYLRKKIDADNEPMIHTVRGVGYMLRPPT